jgi:hypothetical protein
MLVLSSWRRDNGTYNPQEILVGKFLKGSLDFVMKCLHWTVNASQVVLRPLAEQMHGSDRNKIVHYDFMNIRKRYSEYSYVLVIKDDLKILVRLVPAKSCDHVAVAESFLSWF